MFVAQPGVESATGALALLLERRGIEPADLFELRTAVELSILELAVKRLTDECVDALRDTLEHELRALEEALGEVGHDVHVQLARMVDNPVFELLSLVLIRLSACTRRKPPAPPRSIPRTCTRRTLPL